MQSEEPGIEASSVIIEVMVLCANTCIAALFEQALFLLPTVATFSRNQPVWSSKVRYISEE